MRTIDADPSEDISTFVRRLVNSALNYKCVVKGRHNDHEMLATPTSTYTEVREQWERSARQAEYDLQMRQSWQPIDTAPKDGKAILAWDVYPIRHGFTADQRYAIVFWGGSMWVATTSSKQYHSNTLTHWRALPEPPTEPDHTPW